MRFPRSTYLIITANTKEIAEEIKVTISQFLKVRGLTLSEEKTIITHIDDGFDFLGWTFRKYKGKLIIKPSKSSTKAMIRKCSTIILKEMKAKTQTELIGRLNQIIRGWTNYHKHVVASQTFSYINNTLYILLKQWAKHRHPNKNVWWRLNKYWHEKNGKRWLFMTDKYRLINLSRIQIVRHPKLQISKNPFIHSAYYEQRKLQLNYCLPPEMVKKCLSRMSWKLSRTVLRPGKGSNPFSLVDYCSNAYQDLLTEHKIVPSMSRKGNPYDNAVAENFFSNMKCECANFYRFKTRQEAKQAIF